MEWQGRFYPTDVFAGLVASVDALIAAERILAPALVKDEIGAVGTAGLIEWHGRLSFHNVTHSVCDLLLS